MNEVLRGRRILVTGSAGVIGLELLKRLIAKGANILSVDRYPLPIEYDRNVTHVQRDLAAAPLYELHNFQPEIIFHLAAAFERSKESPEFWRVNWHDNMLLSHHVIDQAKDVSALKTFVFASSYLIYAPSLYISNELAEEATYLKEGDPVNPRNITGAAKYYTERELEFVREYYNPSLRVVNARIYRVYGCGSKDVVSRWVQAALSGRQVELYNKQNSFDFIFAGDVAEGLLRLAENPGAEGAVNLGSGVAQSIQDVLNILSEHIPMTQLRIHNLGTIEPFEANCADSTRLKHLTGWVPLTNLEKGIKIIIEFEQSKTDQEITHG